MNAFSAGWLALREPFDREARAGACASFDLEGLAARLRGEASALTVLDLACGTGANLRALAPRLGGVQRWTLVDHDPRLLAAMPAVFTPWARATGLSMNTGGGRLCLEGSALKVEVEMLHCDLAQPLDAALLGRHRLITASALLDLVSVRWIDALAVCARKAEAALLFALSVDGSALWQPSLRDDDGVGRLFAAHQRRDKGFGPALGGDAVQWTAARLSSLGYEVTQAASDWRIDGRDGAHSMAMLRAMVEGAAAAAIEQDPSAAPWIRDWTAQRLDRVERTTLRVGHRDLLATLP
ncbi:class I SAM-dependent methyltransferase [Variovorax ureilyticus]|uniref:class I SAM-dependent methyltransferase n=1 Tax=Variovorax ureilyticus TaxID=1836198 RepID=UPI003D665A3C